MYRSIHAALAIVLGVFLFTDSTVPADAQPRASGDVFVAFRGPAGPAEEALVRGAGGTVRHRYPNVAGNVIAARVPSQALQGLQNNPNVALVEPDVRVQGVHINQPGQTEAGNAWGVDRTDAEVVHAAGITGSGVRLAIVDSGSGPHDELNIAPENRLGCIGQPCRAGSGPGYDDDNGHGTHVAGSAAARALNHAPYGGVVGMAPGATLISLKVLGADGGGSYSDVVAALDWLAGWSNANGKRIQVANFSLGSSDDPGVTVKNAFDTAYNTYNILSVASAGNTGNSTGTGDNVIYPARYDSVVAVAATNRSDGRASFSSTGPQVELAAPGVDIWSTHLGGGYGYVSGTSMAAPHATGAAALRVGQVGPAARNSDIRNRLQTTTKDFGPRGRDRQYGFGLIDPLKETGTAPGSLDTHR